MTASLYRGEIRELPVGADLIPYLIFEGPYEDAVNLLREMPARPDGRRDGVLYLLPPQFDEPEPQFTSSWANKPDEWLPGTMLPAIP